MAISVSIVDARIDDNKLAIVLVTTNTEHVGDTRRIGASFITTMTALEIKAAIDTAVTLLWRALSNPSWTL